MPRITRRTMLKGMLGGVAVAVALPPLEAFMNACGTAYADASPFPRRFGVWFWGNGIIPARWNPTGEGAGDAWTLSEQLMPLLRHKAELSVVSGTRVLTANTEPHGSGPAGLFSGENLVGGTYARTSLDQVIAKEVGSQTRFASLEVGVQRGQGNEGRSVISYAGPNQANPVETSPRALFNRLFVDGFRAPGDMSMPDPKVGLRRSVLDAVIGQSGRLKQRLGASDKARMDQHLEGVRALELRLQRLEQAPPNLAACMKPAEPLEEYPDLAGRAQLSAISRVVSDIVAMALACDQTRVFTNIFTRPVNNLLFPNSSAGHHQLTHDEAGDQPMVNAIVLQIIEELAYFLDALKRVPEGDGTLLDHSVVFATTDCSLARTHSVDDYPMILAGSANGALKTGLHYRSKSSENALSVMLTLLRVMGVRAASWGEGAGKTTDGLSAILA